jgi:hypothetical protein
LLRKVNRHVDLLFLRNSLRRYRFLDMHELGVLKSSVVVVSCIHPSFNLTEISPAGSKAVRDLPEKPNKPVCWKAGYPHFTR